MIIGIQKLPWNADRSTRMMAMLKPVSTQADSVLPTIVPGLGVTSIVVPGDDHPTTSSNGMRGSRGSDRRQWNRLSH
jgi:hypothetical protein